MFVLVVLVVVVVLLLAVVKGELAPFHSSQGLQKLKSLDVSADFIIVKKDSVTAQEGEAFVQEEGLENVFEQVVTFRKGWIVRRYKGDKQLSSFLSLLRSRIDIVSFVESDAIVSYYNSNNKEQEEEEEEEEEEECDSAWIPTDMRVETDKKPKNWGLDRIDQRNLAMCDDYTYQSSAGENTTIYVADTGVYLEHDDFEGRASYGYNVYPEEGDTDVDGHGTHVASTSAGKNYGVAKKAKIVSVKVLRNDGVGSISGIVEGIEWVMNNGTPHRSVINMSLGAGGISVALELAVRAATDAGFIVVAAAGNSNEDACGTSPARSGDVITVASTDDGDRHSAFSNWGACIDIHAPGEYIKAASPDSPSSTRTYSGTSMAAPHVAGVAALVIDRFQDRYNSLFTADVMAYLEMTGTPDIVQRLPVPEETPNLFLYSLFDCDIYAEDGCKSKEEEMTVGEVLYTVAAVAGFAFCAAGIFKLLFRRRPASDRSSYTPIQN